MEIEIKELKTENQKLKKPISAVRGFTLLLVYLYFVQKIL